MRKLILPFLVAVLLLAALPLALDAQTTWQRFENVWVKSLKTTGNATIGGTLTSTGAMYANGDMVVIGTHGVSGDLNVTDDVVIADSLTVTGTAALVGNVDVTGNLEVVDHIANSGQMYFVTGAAATVTDGGTITPTEALVELTAAGNVGASLGTCADGQFVMLVNTANQTITITDTGTTRLEGNWAGAQYDTLTLACVGVAWYEITRANN